MSNNNNEKTEELIESEKLTPQEEQEAYFLLIQIFFNAQATQNQAQFEHDLAEWKKRFQIDLFSDEYKRKIKYMLSKEFLDTIIKNFSIYQEQAQMDYSKGLKKLHKIFNQAKNHKNAQQLDKDLDTFFSIYSKDIFKKNYPHIITRLLSKSYRNEILEKDDKSNDESNATNELNEINELDLTEGQVVELDENPFDGKTRSIFFENARMEFFVIANENIGDTDKLFDWIYKYGKYINQFDDDTKNAIVNNLMKQYHNEFHSSNTNFQIPKMDSGIEDLLSLSEFEAIDDTKKQVVLQLLGILYNGLELTHDDIGRLDIINANVQKAKIIEETQISDKLDDFMEEYPEDELTPCALISLEPNSASSLDLSISDDIDLEISTNENGNTVVEETQIHSVEPNSFKTALKVTESIERISSSSNNSSSSDSGNNAGGSSISISFDESESNDKNKESIDEEDRDEEQQHDSNPSIMISNVNNDIPVPKIDEKIQIRKIEPNTENHSIEDTPEPPVVDTSDTSTDTVDNLDKKSISSEDNINSIDDSFVASVEIITSHKNTSPMQTEPEDIPKNEPPVEEVVIEPETSDSAAFEPATSEPAAFEPATSEPATSKPEEPFVNTEAFDSEKEVTHTKPFQNLFNRMLGRKKTDVNDDRDDR